jgi:glycosyltransferase involved in cell wall biosynthesis
VPFLIKFSVVLPVRNGWPYIKECVESILAQTYAQFDLIVLDNQSTDQTLEWLKSRDDTRIRIHTSPIPLSIVESWARAKDVERQEYMTLIGHDDVFDPNFLETIRQLIEHHPTCALYQTDARLINSDGKKIRTCVPVPELETAAQYLKARFTFNRDTFGTGFVMRSTDYDRVGGIPPFERLSFADDALWLSLLGSGNKACAPGEHFSVRVHPKSESASLTSLWPTVLSGLSSLSDFLNSFVQTNEDAREVYSKYGPDFMLAYHRNALIMALVESSEAGRRIDPDTIDRFRASLIKTSPALAAQLFRSPKVAAVAALNASPLRSALLPLWGLYSRYKMRS